MTQSKEGRLCVQATEANKFTRATHAVGLIQGKKFPKFTAIFFLIEAQNL
jgi:hypothetical protein